MSRLLVCSGMLLFAALQVGCYGGLYKGLGGGCQGCGQSYWGAYVDDPPRPEPCDECGNWVGHCGACKCGGCGDRDRGNMWTFLHARLRSDQDCCDGCQEYGGCFLSKLFNRCQSCTAETECGCGAPACEPECGCGETTCGEPACGCGEPGCGAGVAHNAAYVEQGVVASRSPRRTVQTVSRATVVSTASAPPGGNCNCGRR